MANLIITKKKVKKEEVYTLTLNRTEVEVLKAITGSILGPMRDGEGFLGPRGVADEIYYAIPNTYHNQLISFAVKENMVFKELFYIDKYKGETK